MRKLSLLINGIGTLLLILFIFSPAEAMEEVVAVPEQGIFSEDELEQMRVIQARVNYEIEQLYTPEKLARLKQEIESQPNAEKPRMELVEYYIFTEQYEKAIPLLQQVAKINPDNEMAVNLLKSLKHLLGQI